MYNKFYLILALVVTSFRGYKFACKLSEDDLDKCMYDVMYFGSENAIIPANEDDLNKHCTQVKHGVNCMRDYSVTCLEGFPQQVFGMIVTNMGIHMDKRCGNPKDRAEFLENAKCFIPREKMAPLNICSDKHTKFIELATHMTAEDHIPFSCCGYQLFKDCIVTNTKQICGEGHSQYWDEIFDDVASESVAFACADFDSKDNCAKLLKPDIWSQLKTINDATDPSVWHHGYRTPVKFMLEMVKKFHMNS